MTLWIAVVVMSLLSLIWVLASLVIGSEEAWESELPDLDLIKKLRREKAKVMRALKDIEFEIETGGLTEEGARVLRDQYRNQAALIQRDINACSTNKAVAGSQESN